MWGEILTADEVAYCRELCTHLRAVSWAAPLLARVCHGQEWNYDIKPLLFELRFADALHRAKIDAEYEYPAGMGDSTVDFRFTAGDSEWLVELVSLQTSNAVRAASWENGPFFGVALSSGGQDPRQSLEGETLLAQQKIGEKVFRYERAIKFPIPKKGQYNVIVADMRGFGITGGDYYDYHDIMYGPGFLDPQRPIPYKHWPGEGGETTPILGLMDENNDRQRAAATLQERVHFVGFCQDESYTTDSLIKHTIYLNNPHLFRSHEELVEAQERYPLKA